MTYDPNKHHRRSIRLKGYDYAQRGAYFVTLCAKERVCLFGEVMEGQMSLNAWGRLAARWWKKLPERYPGTDLDAFVVTPNHVHGIITITADSGGVGAIHELPLREPPTDVNDPAQRRKMTLPKMIGYFKMNTAKRINQMRGTPGEPVWQRNYYEHIVRGRRDLERIRRYIAQNPAKWHRDRNHPERMR